MIIDFYTAFAVDSNRYERCMDLRLVLDPRRRSPCLPHRFDQGWLLIVTQIQYAWHGRKSWGEFVPARLNILSLMRPLERIRFVPRRTVSCDSLNCEGTDCATEQVLTLGGYHLDECDHLRVRRPKECKCCRQYCRDIMLKSLPIAVSSFSHRRSSAHLVPCQLPTDRMDPNHIL